MPRWYWATLLACGLAAIAGIWSGCGERASFADMDGGTRAHAHRLFVSPKPGGGIHVGPVPHFSAPSHATSHSHTSHAGGHH